ncbi:MULTISPECIES: AAA family ATPase [unclassified Shewanella]|uniref:AAA family ATPase n=1 Tax=unclassified Shewanella TaxID=196818 RepID=UPI001BB9D06D|nr:MULTISPECIES: AAA family ATPase [unclassified Shewanella]GIU18805.1 ATPase AAA [Shewanella sp. MBTL60-112-B1]GIU37896.1 ATPase AAA [Shewanella sp. MBTL60-112-B2]
MSILAGSTLLPSQDELLHRLLHLSLYGDQLMVLTGEDGAGKTTLATALVNELDNHSSALVICPKHCDSAEIRRKILIQLLSDPVFDDEIPLPECLLSVLGSLPAVSCIVLDDAHLLPLEVWAECIVLSQMTLPGKVIKILMTSPSEFLNNVLTQLPDSLLEQVLAINIEPLEQAEREGLYYTLLSRSEQQPFTPRDIVKNRLEQHQGTPKEVVNLLELALNGEQELPPKKSKLTVLIATSILSITALLAAWGLSDNNDATNIAGANKIEFALETNEQVAMDNAFLLEYAERVLEGYLPISHSSENRLVSHNERTANDPESVVKVTPIDESIESSSVAFSTAVVTTYRVEQAPTFDAIEQPVKPTRSQFSEQQVESIDKPSANGSEDIVPAERVDSMDLQAQNVMPVKGYTLQLASVKRLDSLHNTLKRLKGIPQVKVARYKQRWVVLLGEFGSRKIAQQQSALLIAENGISEPWIRAWQNLSEYELQDVLPTREIQ